MTPLELRAARAALVADRGLTGPALRASLVALTDTWLRALLPDAPGFALVAVGGYGRRELSPGSDLDLLLLHDGSTDEATLAGVADAVWYPVWDTGLALDHSVRTPAEALAVGREDLRAALGLLDARHLAGDPELTATVASGARTDWRARARTRLPVLHEATASRHRSHGELAFLLEPDLKECRGGLRDAAALTALALAQVADPPRDGVAAGVAFLLDVRDALHRRTGAGRGRSSDLLVLQEQDGVAVDLGHDDADALMHAVATAARRVAHESDATWRRVLRGLAPTPRRRLLGGRAVVAPARTPLATGVVAQDGEVVLARDADPSGDPVLVLRAAMAAAAAGLPLAPVTLGRLAAAAPLPLPWPPAALDALVALLGTGPPLVGVWESLDAEGLVAPLLPEWAEVRSRPQRNAYHRFTVDRHSLVTVVEAAARARTVRRPDLLLLAALLHDIGKGRPGDHCEVGAGMIAEIGPRLGLPPRDTATLTTLVRHHLLLADTAARRDPDDPATVAAVAAAVGDTATLELLHALAESDSVATGPSMWSPWKAGVLADLVRRTAAVLAGEPPPAAAEPTAAQALLLAGEGVAVEVAEGVDDVDTVEIAAPDASGLLAAVAGTLALHRLEVRAVSTAVRADRALLVLTVSHRHGAPDRSLLRDDLRRAVDGRADPAARLAQREASSPPARAAALLAPPTVRLLDDVADTATVVEVRAHDAPGLLHRVLTALAGCGLVLTSARVSTLGAEAVDAFYVREPDGALLTDPARRAEVTAAVLAVVGTGQDSGS